MPLMPRPGTPVIPSNWEAHHRPVANGQMTAACQITRPADPAVFDEAGGRSVYPDPAVLYDGPCRIQASQRLDNELTVGDAQITMHRYQVALPAEVHGLRINDEVQLTACSDPDLTVVGRVLRIVDILSGSLLWQRDLVCTDTTPTTR